MRKRTLLTATALVVTTQPLGSVSPAFTLAGGLGETAAGDLQAGPRSAGTRRRS